jgi:hypothetical protein
MATGHIAKSTHHHHAPRHEYIDLSYRGSFVMYLRHVERLLGRKIMPGRDADLLSEAFIADIHPSITAYMLNRQ